PPLALDRVEAPEQAAVRRGEGVQRAASVRRLADRAQVDGAVRDLGRQVDEALRRADEDALPEQSPGAGREREGDAVGRAVDSVARDGDAVRAGIRRAEPV